MVAGQANSKSWNPANADFLYFAVRFLEDIHDRSWDATLDIYAHNCF